MDYDEAMEATVSRAQAKAEIEKHHADRFDEAIAEFLVDVGDKETYTGAEVLGWLGY